MIGVKTSDINYPYMPPGRRFEYVSGDNRYMTIAKEYAREHSLDKTMPTGSVVVKDGEVVGVGSNGSDYHTNNVCERVKLNLPTGEGYELCEGCHPKNHSEPRAIQDALGKEIDIEGADLYLWGHWWCCKPCWNSIIDAKIDRVFLLEGSDRLFDKNHPENIVGKQFEI